MAKKKKKELDILDLEVEKDKARKYITKFHKARNFNRDRADAYAELLAFYQGNQHLLKTYNTKQPWVVNMNTPYAAVAIDKRVGSLLANDYIGDLLPLSEKDIETLDAVEAFYHKEWERMGMDALVRESISQSSVVRESYIHIYYNKDKVYGGTSNKRQGVLEAYNIDPAAVYIDPTARHIKDARFIFITGRISKDEAIIKYPKLKDALNGGDSFTAEDRGEVYKDNDYLTEQDDVLTKLTYYGKTADGKIERVELVNNIIVKEPFIMELTRFPLAQMRWKKASQSCYGLSLMDEVLSMQKALSAIDSAITNTAIAYAAPSMMVREGCGIDPKMLALTIGAPGAVYCVKGDLDNALRPVVPPKIDDKILSIKADYEQKIDKITGNTQEFQGNLGTAGNTKGGANAAIDRAKIIEVKVLKNIGEFVDDATNIMIEHIVYLYPNEVFSVYDGKSLNGKDHKFKTIKIPNAKKLEHMQFKFYIELDTKTPYNKARQKEALLEMFQIERQYDTPIKSVTISDIIKNSDLENKDEIISRFNNLTFQDAQTKAETIADLTAQAAQFGIDPQIVNSAVAEIIASLRETPATDELMKMMEDAFQAEMQKNDQTVKNAVAGMMNNPQSQQEIQQLAEQQLQGGGQEMPPEMQGQPQELPPEMPPMV
jgi:hypothetical protein